MADITLKVISMELLNDKKKKSNTTLCIEWKPLSSINFFLNLSFSYVESGFRKNFKGLVKSYQEDKLTAVYHMEYYSFLLLPLENMNIRKRFARQ